MLLVEVVACQGMIVHVALSTEAVDPQRVAQHCGREPSLHATGGSRLVHCRLARVGEVELANDGSLMLEVVQSVRLVRNRHSSLLPPPHRAILKSFVQHGGERTRSAPLPQAAPCVGFASFAGVVPDKHVRAVVVRHRVLEVDVGLRAEVFDVPLCGARQPIHTDDGVIPVDFLAEARARHQRRGADQRTAAEARPRPLLALRGRAVPVDGDALGQLCARPRILCCFRGRCLLAIILQSVARARRPVVSPGSSLIRDLRPVTWRLEPAARRSRRGRRRGGGRRRAAGPTQ
mmetsp:Transcript_86607/g.279636  ORF Transcript_86607/g.279636 Transcript_86607/m.279636 type:complete len:290 (-) Transcript_86607:779-1648(-)